MALAIGPQCATTAHNWDPPKSHPRLGEVPEGLNTLEVVRMEVVKMVLMDQVQLGTSKQAQLVAGWVSAKPVARAMGSLTRLVAVLVLGGSITRALTPGHRF